jgi:hypothetical protein
MTERKVLERWQQSLYKPAMQPCPPHGHGERRLSTRPFARIFYLTISLLLAFLANCEKPVPLSPPGAIAVSLLVWLAGALLMTLPVIAIFFFAQRYFLRGVTLTGIKG